MGRGPRQDAVSVDTAQGCAAKAASIRRIVKQLSDPATIKRALEVAQRWDDKAEKMAAEGK